MDIHLRSKIMSRSFPYSDSVIVDALQNES